MDIIDLTQFENDGFTLKFEGPAGLIRVETLTEALSGFAEALEAIGTIVDPSTEIDVYVDDLSPGSVKIGVKLKKKLKSIDGAAVAGTVILGVLTSYLYDLVKVEEKCSVVVSDDTVRIMGSGCDVTLGRKVHEAAPAARANTKIAEGVTRALSAVKDDKAVTGIGFGKHRDATPALHIARSNFNNALNRLGGHATFLTSPVMEVASIKVVHETRVQTQRVNLIILKAWLRRSKHKWMFNWQGLKVSAPILDPDFFDQLEKRSIALHQGDALDADLAITQNYLSDARVWENSTYAVTKVYAVKLGETQTTMDFTSRVPLPKPHDGKLH